MVTRVLGWRRAVRSGDRAISAALIALVLSSLLPILAFSAGLAWMYVEDKTHDAETNLRNVARALSTAVDRELNRHIGVLETLTLSASLDSDDLTAYDTLARRVVAAQGSWLDLGLLDARTKMLLSSTRPMPVKPVLTVAPAAFERVLRTRKPVIVGAFPAATVVNQPTIRLMVPVVRGDEVRYVLAGLVDPATMGAVFSDQGLPPSWTGAVLDDRMTIAARSRNAERLVGQPVQPTVAEQIALGNTGLFASNTAEGDRLYAVFSRSEATGWSVVLGIPVAEVDAPKTRVVMGILASGGMVVALAFGLAGVLGRRIVAGRRAYEGALRTKAGELEDANRKLAELSASDALTGLANRRRFDEALSVEWFRARRSGRTVALLMIDVDFFKTYNDVYGHQAGDRCLQAVAGVLRSTARRASDVAARFGGDEFCIVAPELDLEGAGHLAEAIGRQVAALALPNEKSPYGVVTLSIGAAALTPDARNGREDLIRLADHALYEAKRRGRNQINAAAPEASAEGA